MKLVRLGTALSVVLGLAACAVSRPPETVAAATPPQWYAPPPHGGSLSDLKAWWQQFNDPVLVELIEAAQTVSPNVASAGSRIEQARAARVGAGSRLLPGVDAGASVTRGNTQVGLGTATTGSAGLQAAWEIDLFGGNRAAVDAAQARFEGAQAGWHDARVAVAAETANTYVSLRSCERLLQVTLSDAQSRAESSRLTQISADAGFTAPANAALARASAAEASARATQQRALCDLDVKALVALSALPEPALRQKLAAPWTEPTQFAMLALPALPAALLQQRPDVFLAERELAAAAADVATARADRLPRITLSGQIGRSYARINGASTEDTTWAIGPLGVTLPLFDGGRRAANVDASVARYEEQVALYTARVRQAVREVEEALVNLDSARARSADAITAVEGYRTSFAAAEARYRNGLANLLELEEVRRVTLAAEIALVNLQRERVASWIALYRAVGGGWERPVATAARP